MKFISSLCPSHQSQSVDDVTVSSMRSLTTLHQGTRFTSGAVQNSSEQPPSWILGRQAVPYRGYTW